MSQIFSDAQKAVLPLVIIPCALLCFILYRYGKRPIIGVNKTFEQRMDYLYALAACELLGEFMFPNGGRTTYLNACTMLGFFIMFAIQKYSRVWHDNPNYVSPESTTVEIRSSLDPNRMEIVEYLQSDILDDSTGSDKVALLDETVELTKRRRICVLTVLIMSFLCILEGFFLRNNWLVIGMFFVDKLMETTIVCISLLHSLMHCTSEGEWNWYIILSVWWCVVCVCSTISACTNNAQAAYIINHVATSIFYSLAGGVLFWIALYYTWIDQKKTDKKETSVRLAIFVAGASVSWVVGYFY